MNRNSLSYNNIQKQYPSSWTDDPFQINDNVKGLTKMNHNQALANYAQELVLDYASYEKDGYELSLAELPEDAQNELSRLYIESCDRDISECVYGDDFSIENNYTCAILAMLKNDCKETRESLSEVIRKNIVIYYSDSLQQVLSDACDDLQDGLNEESNNYLYQDTETGETIWGKF